MPGRKPNATAGAATIPGGALWFFGLLGLLVNGLGLFKLTVYLATLKLSDIARAIISEFDSFLASVFLPLSWIGIQVPNDLHYLITGYLILAVSVRRAVSTTFATEGSHIGLSFKKTMARWSDFNLISSLIPWSIRNSMYLFIILNTIALYVVDLGIFSAFPLNYIFALFILILIYGDIYFVLLIFFVMAKAVVALPLLLVVGRQVATTRLESDRMLLIGLLVWLNLATAAIGATLFISINWAANTLS